MIEAQADLGEFRNDPSSLGILSKVAAFLCIFLRT
jgi:hypothetical protein